MFKSILVTGGAGFIGSNFVPYFCQKYPEYHIVNLDKLTYAGDLSNLVECEHFKNYTFVKGDICNHEFIKEVFARYNICSVIHFAAESHVDNSIANPFDFIQTNVLGTFNLLDVAYKFWMNAPKIPKENFVYSRFHHISTDEVYGTLGEFGYFKETTPYAPNSPYSASKASSDLLVRAYFHTYGMNVTTSNCSNNYGPKQHKEKLIPKIIYNCLNNMPITIYGTGKNIRDWLYVKDHCNAIDLIFHKANAGETYNIGGHNEKTNLEVAYTICSYLDKKVPRQVGKYADLITFVKDRAGHDLRYAIDPSKITHDLNWKPDESFDTGIIKTIDWYILNS
ncbi:dTDP-glucose 4,6-dehydratase [uncultured Succinatimonas sp.]|uniref:dTDP-glucose 4,6-dehydratase n=1 Tax=uncultured Succinatimonas sp. TaxID=1262973 RepID=UPI0025FE6A72|nr:dTDP-glucose 4,6-dehydratase [uncultured Succinatimonas sp.]